MYCAGRNESEKNSISFLLSNFLLRAQVEQRLDRSKALIIRPNAAEWNFPGRSTTVASSPPLNWLSFETELQSLGRWRAALHDKLINENGFPNTDSCSTRLYRDHNFVDLGQSIFNLYCEFGLITTLCEFLMNYKLHLMEHIFITWNGIFIVFTIPY